MCVAYINHQGGTTLTDLSKNAKELWNLCLQRKVKLRAEHISGIQNVIADQASWLKKDRNDWMLHPKIFSSLHKIWGPFQIDLFTTRMNTQLLRYFSWTL